MSDITSLSSLSSEEDNEQPRRNRRIRHIRDRSDPFIEFDATDFRMRFKFRKETVLEILRRFEHLITPASKRNKAISPLNQLLITLRFYATGAFQNCLGDHIHISQPSVSRIIARITRCIAHRSNIEIRMPDPNESVQVCSDFYGIANFPRVVGAIDCTHIKITSPGGENAELYRNRKGYFSINVEAVCDAHLIIRHIVARWPGSVHDATIFNDGPLPVNFQGGRHGANNFLLGDSGYPCKLFLLTPLLHPRTPAEVAYNTAHKKTRNTVERCFGVLKK
ncbi:hypothetical protein Zmor_000862 [Zophobas morio]|uniref:Putative nuclease HARBI1 n=1 Tax=Zophobas morio TaxID=2755281 RepID=A0AA38IZZ9_9CUCU|nr:hypothetical protein Zmor_000862 [Zophobas morio]